MKLTPHQRRIVKYLCEGAYLYGKYGERGYRISGSLDAKAAQLRISQKTFHALSDNWLLTNDIRLNSPSPSNAVWVASEKCKREFGK